VNKRNDNSKPIESGQHTPASQTSLSPLWTRKQVAEALKVCPHSVARYTRAGLLPCVRLNRRVVRYRLIDVEKLIEAGFVSQ
jgi:Helix-turn-helix domain